MFNRAESAEVHQIFGETSGFVRIVHATFVLDGFRQRAVGRIAQYLLQVSARVRKRVRQCERNGKHVAGSVIPLLVVKGEDAILTEDGKSFLGIQIVRATRLEQSKRLTLAVLLSQGMGFDLMGNEGMQTRFAEPRPLTQVHALAADSAIGDNARTYLHLPFVHAIPRERFRKNLRGLFGCQGFPLRCRKITRQTGSQRGVRMREERRARGSVESEGGLHEAHGIAPVRAGARSA